MKNISKRRFVYCYSSEREVPIMDEEQCCEYFNNSNHRCEAKKYSSTSTKIRLSQREENYETFSNNDEE